MTQGLRLTRDDYDLLAVFIIFQVRIATPSFVTFQNPHTSHVLTIKLVVCRTLLFHFMRKLNYYFHGNHHGQMHPSSQESHGSKPLLGGQSDEMLFWILTPCRMAGRTQLFGEAYCVHLQGEIGDARKWRDLYSQGNERQSERVNQRRGISISISLPFL